MINFWKKLSKPFTALAPMDDVTNSTFRQVVMRAARPDVFFTEFVSVEGLCSPGRNKIIQKLNFQKNEHPIVAQVWGKTPENYLTAAKEITDMGFDGIDINMGCPDKAVVKSGAGAALIENKKLVSEIIDATTEGVRGKIPVSVKTRIGRKEIITEDWISFLLSQKIEAITIHGRTQAEMSKVAAHWDEIGKSVQLRNQISAETVIIGNGDVNSFMEVQEKCLKYGVDGVMIGRGVFHDLYVFDKLGKSHLQNQGLLKYLLKHLNLFDESGQNIKRYPALKKYFKIYVKGFDRASELRDKLMGTESTDEAREVLELINHNRHSDQA
jgi:tRNA-dihydrouridine synthase